MRLSVPHRTAPHSGSFDSTPGRVKEWVEALPTVGAGQATRLLFEALSDLNQQDIPVRQRFETLEILRKPVRLVTERMIRHFVGQPLPLAPRNLRIARLSREITHLLATGYKIVVVEQIAGVYRSDRMLLVTAMHRALRLLGCVLLRSYQVYEPYPDSVWLEIHSLYRYAEEKGVAATGVSEDDDHGKRPSTIGDAYKQVLLLALACPYRLKQAEAQPVYSALEQWAPLAELGQIGENGSSALFITNLDSDQPPTYLVLRPGINPNTCRALDTSRLAERISKALDAQPHGASPSSCVTRRTLQHLTLAWGVMPKRRYARIKDWSDVVVAVGLESIHYFVSGEAAFNNVPAPEGLCNERDTASHAAAFRLGARAGARETHEAREDAHNEHKSPGAPALHATLDPAVAKAVAGPHIDTSQRVQHSRMLNVSAGGYCLLWDNPDAARAQVGELLGIREESDPDTFHWRLGVIRWLKCAEQRGLELGVQMLPSGAVAVALRRDASSHELDGVRALLLPAIAALQQQVTLLLPPQTFKQGDTVIASCQGRRVRLQLTKLVENTGSFAQFQFSPLGEVEQQPPPRQAAGTGAMDFNDLWDLL